MHCRITPTSRSPEILNASSCRASRCMGVSYAISMVEPETTPGKRSPYHNHEISLRRRLVGGLQVELPTKCAVGPILGPRMPGAALAQCLERCEVKRGDRWKRSRAPKRISFSCAPHAPERNEPNVDVRGDGRGHHRRWSRCSPA